MSIQIIVEIEEHNGFPYEKPAPSLRQLKGEKKKLSVLDDSWFEKEKKAKINGKDEKKNAKNIDKNDEKKKPQK